MIHRKLQNVVYMKKKSMFIKKKKGAGQHRVLSTSTCARDIEFLTCGNDNLTYEQNSIIFKYVFDYIKCSKRFLIV